MRIGNRFLALVLAVFILLLAGCQSDPIDGANEEIIALPTTAVSGSTVSREGGETAVPTGEVVKITFAASGDDRAQFELRAALFNQLNPDMVVEIVNLSPNRDPATQADTAVLRQPPTNATQFTDMADLLQQSTAFSPQDFFDGALQGCEADEYIYGVPVSISPAYLYYDEARLTGFGVDIPTADWDWNDLVRAIEAASSGDGFRYGFAGVDGLLALLRPLLTQNVDENGLPNVDDLTPYLDEITNLTADLHVKDVDALELQSLVLNGRVGFWLGNPATFSPRLAELSSPLKRLPVPTLGNLNSTNPVETSCLLISRGTPHPNEAWRWLQYLILNAQELATGNVPANQHVFAEFSTIDLASNNPTAVAINRAWFNNKYFETEAIMAALRQHLADGVPLAEALSQVNLAAADEFIEAESAPVISGSSTTDGGSEIVTVDYFAFALSGELPQLDEAAAVFNEIHPNIDVIPFLLTEDNGGYVPFDAVVQNFDCFAWSVGGTLSEDLVGAALDISELVSPDILADFSPEMLAWVQAGNKLLGLPLEINPIVVRYNESRFNELNVPLPTADWTFDEMLTIASQFGESGEETYYGFNSSVYGTLFGPDILRLLLLEEGIQLWDISTGEVNLTGAPIEEAITEYISATQQNSFFADSDWFGATDIFSERHRVLGDGNNAMWATLSNERPFFLGEPEPFAVLPLPELNSQILGLPTLTGMFISERAVDPTPCMLWIEFLTTHLGVITAVPARQSVADGPAWQNDVGPENAAVYLEALRRHFALSRPENNALNFVREFPLYEWLQEVVDEAAEGGDLIELLGTAQEKSDLYMACIITIPNPTFDQITGCKNRAKS